MYVDTTPLTVPAASECDEGAARETSARGGRINFHKNMF